MLLLALVNVMTTHDSNLEVKISIFLLLSLSVYYWIKHSPALCFILVCILYFAKILMYWCSLPAGQTRSSHLPSPYLMMIHGRVGLTWGRNLNGEYFCIFVLCKIDWIKMSRKKEKDVKLKKISMISNCRHWFANPFKVEFPALHSMWDIQSEDFHSQSSVGQTVNQL